ncbi:kinase-like protein [Aureobasidium pullulans]|uniref:Kinase-like protein n=1 Tax=Aureobasidium pullulans TaxID=5580 RepID=A0A4S9UQT5_AURPU|nr:kinase-like protein [Aureobasidium pullulans]THZ40248.1 kinase-like protein [Aureobasidium pullulans]THZ57880.1 kinase-like protein [Aureobasidium pullulans]THZ74110.1 kinase-like protein [Aureobasidium pullulans]
MNLLMAGSARTYRITDAVLKTVDIADELPLLEHNIKAMRIEASVYTILGKHPRIAETLYISGQKEFILLKYYRHGNLKDHIAKHPNITSAERKRWARQMIEGVAEIHRNGIRHSDIRLDQWLLDDDYNARLCDFNGSDFDTNERLGLEGIVSDRLENPSHFMPRDPMEDSTVLSDLFALGSTLYELDTGKEPFSGMFDEKHEEEITALFEAGNYPEVSVLSLGALILGCWKGEYETALDLLRAGEKSCGL